MTLTDQQCITIGLAAECLSCATAIGPKSNPPEYAQAVARLMLAIGAHESGGWKYRRQVGFEESLGDGAFGLFQQQENFIEDCLSIFTQASMWNVAIEWLNGNGHRVSLTWFAGICDNQRAVAGAVTSNDRLAIALCRVYLLKRAKGPIPNNLHDAARYAARYYNRGPEQERYAGRIIEDWGRYIAPCAEYLDWLEYPK